MNKFASLLDDFKDTESSEKFDNTELKPFMVTARIDEKPYLVLKTFTSNKVDNVFVAKLH